MVSQHRTLKTDHTHFEKFKKLFEKMSKVSATKNVGLVNGTQVQN